MNYDIQNTLEQLEASLQNINSAKQQVDSVVTAYKQLSGTVTTYVNSINTLLCQVQGLISDISSSRNTTLEDYRSMLESLQLSCNNFITLMTNKCDEISSNFKLKVDESTHGITNEVNRLNSEIGKLSELSNKFNTGIQTVEGLKTSIDELTKDLKQSQDAQDTVLANIENKISIFITQANSSLTSITSIINTIGNKLDDILSAVRDMGNSTNNHFNTVNNSLDSIREKNELIQKEIKTNRLVIIIGIVPLVSR